MVEEQAYLDDMAPERNERVHRAALEYLDALRKAKKAKEILDDRKEILIETMQGEKIRFYKFENVAAELILKCNVKAKELDSDSDE